MKLKVYFMMKSLIVFNEEHSDSQENTFSPDMSEKLRVLIIYHFTVEKNYQN